MRAFDIQEPVSERQTNTTTKVGMKVTTKSGEEGITAINAVLNGTPTESENGPECSSYLQT
jgi:hypothetical protein